MPKEIPFVCISKVAPPLIDKNRKPNVHNYTFYSFQKIKKAKSPITEYSRRGIKTEIQNSIEIDSNNKIKELESKINKLQGKLNKEQTLNQVLLVNNVDRLNLSIEDANKFNSTTKYSSNSKKDNIFKDYELSFVHRFKQKINELFKIIREKDGEINKLSSELSVLKEENAKLKINLSSNKKSITDQNLQSYDSPLLHQEIYSTKENEYKDLDTYSNTNPFSLNSEGNIGSLSKLRYNKFKIKGNECEFEFEKPLLSFLTKISKAKDLKELMIEFLS